MTKPILIALPILLLAGCNDAPTADAPKPKVAAPAAFPGGQWEATMTVSSIKSTDRTTPIIPAKDGDKEQVKACVADAKQLVELVKAKSDSCKEVSVYTRNGRINNGHACKRPGAPGTINLLLNGKYTADTASFELVSETVLSGSGDYRMKQDVEARRVGDCAAAAG